MGIFKVIQKIAKMIVFGVIIGLLASLLVNKTKNPVKKQNPKCVFVKLNEMSMQLCENKANLCIILEHASTCLNKPKKAKAPSLVVPPKYGEYNRNDRSL